MFFFTVDWERVWVFQWGDVLMDRYLRDYVISLWQLITGFRTQGERRISDERMRDIGPYLDISRPLRVLDLANGRLQPQYLLLKAAGQCVYGIDRINRPASSWMDRAYQIARWLYTRHLHFPPDSSREQTLVCGDVGFLPFKDNSFDFVTSVAAFEHFQNVPAVVGDLHRVMRQGGIAYIRIHLFTCPSGAHNLSSTEIPLRTIPCGVEAWDHLRKRHLPFSAPLNEWRVEHYLSAFARQFEILKSYCAMREGEKLLTPEIEAELSNYSREELTCGAYVIVARKS